MIESQVPAGDRRDIDGKGRTVWELFNNRRYDIDSYQREYKWQTKQLVELVNDLRGKFLEHYKEDHERQEVSRYGHYFLGSIILSQKKGLSFIIDGQQRLTTLTLLLVYLHHRQRKLAENERVEVTNLIMSSKYGKKSYNIDVPERSPCLDKLYSGEPYFPTAKDPEAVRNMVARYNDIEQKFPQEISDEALPYFLDWLLNNVHLVEITAYSDDDAYTIFETMNDRGLSLAPLDMLKGYLIANITDHRVRRLITEEIPARVSADTAYQNAKKNSDRQNARIEHDKALARVIVSLMKDDTELFKQFSDNESFKKWLTDTVFTATYEPAAGERAKAK